MPKPIKKEVRVVICKKCKREIDDVGCCVDCEYDVGYGNRAPETLEVLVYVFNRVEPYPSK